MTTLLWIIAMILVLGALAYLRVSLLTATIAAAVVMTAGWTLDVVGPISWIVFLVVALPLNISAFRQNVISRPLMKVYRGIMPEMSSTEKEAIEAGTTWWEADLFAGNPNWKKLHNYPVARLSADEQAFLDGPVEEVCRMVNQHQVSHQLADLPAEVWQYLKDHGFFAMIIKKKYGGLEYSAYAQSRVLQKLAGLSSELASTVGVPNSLGPGELLQHYGTPEQQNHYLPRLAKGLEVPCFALTSPEAGSDAGSIPDFGIVCKGQWEGEEVLGMKLTWNKRYITLAPVATVLGLAFKLRDPEHLLGDKEELGITCALIPTDVEGVETGRRHFPLNCMFQNGPTRGNEVFVPLSFIIGGPKMAGQGWRMLVECLSVGRGITLPSNSAGGVKTAALATGAYARIRRQFKLPIGKLEGIEEPMARIGGNAYLMDAVTTLTTTGIDLGEKPSVISAIVKYHLTDRMQKCVIDAMDIHGGKGVCLGPNNYLGRGYQAAPIAITVEGANILTRSMIIYGQGAIRCHPYVLAEMESAFDTESGQGLANFDAAIFGHIGFATSNFIRSFWLGLTSSRFSNAPYSDKTKRYYQQMNRFSANLALLSDLAMATLGGNLKRKERISARLGDLLSQLYLASATLKRYEDEGRQTDDLPLVQWAVEDALYKLQASLDDLLDNFPMGLGGALRVVMFPFGRPLKRPSDVLDHKVAKIMQTPCESRDRLGKGQFWTNSEHNAVGIQEQTLLDIIASEPLHDKVCKASGKRLPFMWLDKVAAEGKALGVLSDDEVSLLERAEIGRMKSINVDDFDPAELRPEVVSTTSQERAA
ncbi:MAG: acyl-CoA dehydrogenase FadE [Gammaproteobacteria bacterium]|uniref:acyl-CoA dehydrogenase FadE n=1 Tax=Shewanella sp. Pdp11 TaxID=2059264 RepID=UPI000CA20405|nr:acyl-CoA dehydrogenase FadE [Shewanella sp. Pdp11]MBU1393845.1 acyl-CoA dehydrogenase FadE [Gammaproteobacteria bacterium]QYX66704.1 acyl-CoA dehydrogenase FadE [Shewanella putrefaciens]AUD60236.1 acyl-CoA dehydrogenase [Shewanella sp. Pdp11]MBU1479353.1 acyl-CoA dehydrogenase FadE [Gammaproteobacteria bacterium]MBU2002061.1 acyl-CoA dehydrogenase FadE [Gammaproteobacteria bacterium]